MPRPVVGAKAKQRNAEEAKERRGTRTDLKPSARSGEKFGKARGRAATDVGVSHTYIGASDSTNLQAVCRRCHRVITARRRSAATAAGGIARRKPSRWTIMVRPSSRRSAVDGHLGPEVVEAELGQALAYAAGGGAPLGLPWCGPCRMLAPAIESEVAKRDAKLELAKIDVDAEHPARDDRRLLDEQVLTDEPRPTAAGVAG